MQDLFGNAVGVVGLQQDGRVDAGRQHNAIATRVRVDKVGKIQHKIAIDAPMHGRRPIACFHIFHGVRGQCRGG